MKTHILDTAENIFYSQWNDTRGVLISLQKSILKRKLNKPQEKRDHINSKKVHHKVVCGKKVTRNKINKAL